MRRTRLLALLAAAALAGSTTACGVTADTTAASISGRDIPVDDVTALVEDSAFNPAADLADESTQPGDDARAALRFLLEREAALAEVERWGLDLESERAGVASQIEEQIRAGNQAVSDRYRDLFIDYQTAQVVLGNRFAQLDPDSDEDLRRLYDGSTEQWEQACLTVAQIPADGVDRARDALDEGATVDQMPELVQGAELVARPSEGCFAEIGLIAELRRDLAGATPGVTRDPVFADVGIGGVTTYIYRLDERRTLSFEEARADLAAAATSLAQQGPGQWLQLQLLTATIDPRYGLDVVRSANGLVVAPPPRPLLPLEQRIAVAAEAARQNAAAAGDPAAADTAAAAAAQAAGQTAAGQADAGQAGADAAAGG